MRDSLSALLIALVLVTAPQVTVAADDEFLYSIGGGQPIGRGASTAAKPVVLGGSISWNNDLMCGNFDMKASVKNQMSGLSGYFSNLMDDVINAATGYVASLPALIIQRLNPALYDLLQNGILSASEEFHLGEVSCEKAVESMHGNLTNEGWGSLAKGGHWTESSQETDKDILNAKDEAEKDGLNNGVTWVGGVQAGGQGQEAIALNKDVALAGYNLLLNRDPVDTSGVSTADCGTAPMCEVWDQPILAVQWVVDVIGDREIKTCEGCDKVAAHAGMGLSRKYEEQRIELEVLIADLVNGGVAPDAAALEEVQGAQGMVLSRRVIEAIRDEESPNAVIARLAGEMALGRTLEQALLARRIMLAGMREPNVANNQLALDELRESVKELNDEIQNMVFEMDIRKKVATNTTLALLQRQRVRDKAPAVEAPSPQLLRDGATGQ